MSKNRIINNCIYGGIKYENILLIDLFYYCIFFVRQTYFCQTTTPKLEKELIKKKLVTFEAFVWISIKYFS